MIDLNSVFTTVKEAVVRKQQGVQLFAQDAVVICTLTNLPTENGRFVKTVMKK